MRRASGLESLQLGKGSDPQWIRHLKKTIPGGPELKKSTRLVTAVNYEQAVISDQRPVPPRGARFFRPQLVATI
jgi:hypothetical protein